MELVWADGAYTGGLGEWLRRRLGWRMEVAHHCDRRLGAMGWRSSEKPRLAGFASPLGRGVHLGVVGAVASLELGDYERLPQTGEAMIYGAMSRIMLSRLALAA